MRRGKTDDASGQLRELALAAREAYSEVREGIVALRTLPDPKRSLGDVLRDYLAQWKEQTGTSTELLIDGEPHVRPAVELQLIRIVQEALTNVRKHAHATKVSVTLRRTDGMIDLRVADDGVGFSETSKPRTDFPRFGLSTMRERAESVGATLEVQSAPGGGTIVHLQLPIGNEG